MNKKHGRVFISPKVADIHAGDVFLALPDDYSLQQKIESFRKWAIGYTTVANPAFFHTRDELNILSHEELMLTWDKIVQWLNKHRPVRENLHFKFTVVNNHSIFGECWMFVKEHK